MASKQRAVRDAVATALAGVNGSAPYTYDLSATGAVIKGPQIFPARSLPTANVHSPRFTSVAGLQLGWRTRTIVVDVVGRVGASSDSSADREGNAADLADDMAAALETDPTLGGIVHDLEITAGSADGSALDMYELGICSLTVTTTVEVTGGT